jgi:hypothetical protein
MRRGTPPFLSCGKTSAAKWEKASLPQELPPNKGKDIIQRKHKRTMILVNQKEQRVDILCSCSFVSRVQQTNLMAFEFLRLSVCSPLSFFLPSLPMGGTVFVEDHCRLLMAESNGNKPKFKVDHASTLFCIYQSLCFPSYQYVFVLLFSNSRLSSGLHAPEACLIRLLRLTSTVDGVREDCCIDVPVLYRSSL